MKKYIKTVSFALAVALLLSLFSFGALAVG